MILKVVIFNPNLDMSTNPTLVNLVRRLSEDGIPIDIYRPEEHECYLPQDRAGENIKFHDYQYMPFAAPPGIVGFLYHVKERMKEKLKVFARLLMARKSVVLAVDPRGVVEAYAYCRWLGMPLIYFSFEIFFKDELRLKRDIMLKERELDASRRAALIVVQDPRRGRMLETENGLKDSKMFYLPVAPSANPKVERTKYLREKFNITEDKTIVIHAGSFAEWTYAEELVENAKKWPEEFVLVIHSRHFPGEETKRFVESAKASNIYFSTEPCSDIEFHRLLASADIGLSLYKPTYSGPYTGKNIKTIGLASGKFSYYMKCGIPSISVGQEDFKELLEEYKFGLDIDGFGQFPDALLEIKRNYQQYSAEAKRLFDERLDFDRYYPKLKEEFLSLLP